MIPVPMMSDSCEWVAHKDLVRPLGHVDGRPCSVDVFRGFNAALYLLWSLIQIMTVIIAIVIEKVV